MAELMILGSEWKIRYRSSDEDPRLEDCDGYCDWTIRTIVVRKEIDGNLTDMEAYMRNVLRHEIIHAFLFESGLSHASLTVEQWATNEEMVDWFAFKGPQIYEAWQTANAIEEDKA